MSKTRSATQVDNFINEYVYARTTADPVTLFSQKVDEAYADYQACMQQEMNGMDRITDWHGYEALRTLKAKKAQFTETFNLRQQLFLSRLGNSSAEIQSKNIQFLDTALSQPLLKKCRQFAIDAALTERVVENVADEAFSNSGDKTYDDNATVVTWTGSNPPSWFIAAQQKYLDLRKDRELDENVAMKSLYWRIIDVSNPEELKTYLDPNQIKDITDLFFTSLAACSNVDDNMKPANCVLRGFELIHPTHLTVVCGVAALNGPVGGLRQLLATLRNVEALPVRRDELNEVFAHTAQIDALTPFVASKETSLKNFGGGHLPNCPF
ncbi:hypothetical protein HDU80_002736 [Chytriomyces hyalinus]|nr:hypothetical protein HDU80_002736 [Chytriomyces hyalinus]